jgi:D-3-phosphoglycerate dehydrogenase
MTKPAEPSNRKPPLLYYAVLGFQPTTLAYLEQFFQVATLPDPSHDTPEILREVQVCYAPMGFLFDRAKLEACPQLRVIATPTTGLLHIDTDFAASRGVAICSLKEQRAMLNSITCTAELTWGLLLAVVRHLLPALDSVLAGKWEGRGFGERTPKMISRMSLGVIGLGRLGGLVAQYGAAFGMQVYYYDPYVADDRYIRCATPRELAPRCDVVSIHAHLTPDTQGLVDADFIGLMPRGSYIVNTARGGIVDEAALLAALESGHLAGAALDMLEGEHLPGFKARLAEHPLVRYAQTHDNLIITPKMGGATVGAWERTERHIVDMIRAEMGKEKPVEPA